MRPLNNLRALFPSLLALTPALFGLAPAVRAQTPAPVVTAEMDLDLRSRVAAVGQSGSKLQSTALRLRTDLTPDVRLKFYVTHQYGAVGVQEAAVEKDWGGTAGRAQAGLVRVPFGIYDTRETYASGLIDYPMPRGDYYYHSVDWGVPGAAWSGGSDRLQVEAAAFGGRGSGIWNNQVRLQGAAVRAQTYAGTAILGVSRWDGALQDVPTSPTLRRVGMTGLDLRYTRPQLLIRGEYLWGTLAGDRMRGWYVDTYYRLPGQERWGLAARLERLKPGDDYAESRQITLGIRCVATPDWTLAVNWRRNNGPFYAPTWTPAAGRGGDVYFQAYHRVKW